MPVALTAGLIPIPIVRAKCKWSNVIWGIIEKKSLGSTTSALSLRLPPAQKDGVSSTKLILARKSYSSYLKMRRVWTWRLEMRLLCFCVRRRRITVTASCQISRLWGYVWIFLRRGWIIPFRSRGCRFFGVIFWSGWVWILVNWCHVVEEEGREECKEI